MGKKKVTLSLDSKTYDEFREYCEKNAIMLSKKIEIVIKDIMKGKKFFWFLILSFVFPFMFLNVVSAVTIFSDGFEGGTLNGWNLSAVGNNWTVILNGSSPADAYQGSYSARSQPMSTTEPASILQLNISTSNYQNITFRYYRRLIGLDIADEFKVKWFDGTSWIIVEETLGNSANDAIYVYKEFNLSASANNNANFQIKYECTAGAVSEYCKVDNVVILGNPIQNSDNIAPTVFLKNPANSSTTPTSLNYFAANFSDNVNLANVTLYVWNLTSLIEMNFSISTGTYNETNLSFALPREGSYTWNYLAKDNSSNGAWASGNFSLTYVLPDTTPPEFINTINFSIYEGEEISYDIDATDANGVSCFSINDTINFNINCSGFLKNVTELTAGVYLLNISVNDTSNNINSEIIYVNVSVLPQAVFNLTVNYPVNGILNELTPNLNVSVTGEADSVWFSLDDGENITYAHRNGTIDFAYLDAVFVDDFGSYANGSDGSPVWENLPSFKTAVIDSGRYKLYNETPIIDALASVNNFSEFNYGGSARVMVPTGYFGGAYLTPRFGGVNNKYEIALDYDWSSINVNKVVGGAWTGLGALWTGDKGIFVSKNQWHELGFEIEDDNITAFVDGIEMISVLDSELNDTGFALIAYDFENHHMAYFDDLELHKELNYGYHVLRVYANDSFGNVIFREVSFAVDPPLPQISILYPENNIYGYKITELNYTVFDLNLSSCWYSLDNGMTNASVVCGENLTGLMSDEGNNVWTVWANDTSGNENYSSVNFFVDSINPVFLGHNEYPVNGTTYLQGGIYEFNVTITDSLIDVAGIEFNGVNYSVTNVSDVYTFTISDLGAGVYSYYWWANDSSGNFNISGVRYFSVSKANPDVKLFLNGVRSHLNVAYLTQTNASAYANLTGSLLYRDSVDVTSSENGQNVMLGAGYYNYTSYFAGNENYTFGFETWFLNVTRFQSSASLNFNVSSPQTYGTAINVTCSDTNPEEISKLYRDGIDVTSSENGKSVVLGGGTHAYVCNVTEIQNYTSAEDSGNFVINPAGGEVVLYLNGFGNNLTMQYLQEVNITATTPYGSVMLYLNGEDISSENGLNLIRGAGYYNATAFSSGDENYSGDAMTYWLNITKAQGDCLISSNSPVVFPSQVNVSGGCDNPEASALLYRGEFDVTLENANFVTLGAGSYNYKINATETQNYTSAENSIVVIVSQGASEVNLSLNGTEGNLTITEGESVVLNGTLVIGDISGIMELYVNGSLVNQGVLEISNLILFNDTGLFNVSVFYLGSQNYSASFESYFVEVISLLNSAPNASLNLPENNSVVWGNNAVLNVSVFDADGDNMSVWFYGDESVLGWMEEISNGLVLYNWMPLSEGWHDWNVIVGDGIVNTTSETWRFYVNLSIPTGVMPVIEIAYPSYASVYGYNKSISLNFSVSENELDSCWYSLDSGINNVSILNCVNTSFDVNGSGVFGLTVYANESVEGLIGSEGLEFFVGLNNPTIHLLSPEQEHYTNSSSVQFSYVPEFGGALERCELWGDFNGTYSLNQINDSVVVGSENYFFVYNLTEGNYSWAIFCNSSSGNYSFTGNRTLVSDYTAPNVSIIEPSGTYTTGANVPVSFDVVENSPKVCYYNLTYSADGRQVQFRIIEGCQGTTINVALSSNTYNLEVIARDEAENTGRRTTQFVVTTAGGGVGGSGSGGGGGGGGGLILGEPELKISPLEDVFIERGTSASFAVNVENVGGKFLNKCGLIFGGNSGNWFSNKEIKGLSFGEKFGFDVNLNVPEDTEPDRYLVNAIVKCDELTREKSFDVLVYRNVFEVEILDYERSGSKLRVKLRINENGGVDRNVKLEYALVDLDGFVRYNDEKMMFLKAEEEKEELIEFELPKDSFGEFDFKVVLSDGETEVVANKEIFLPSQSGLTGFIISDANRRTLSYLGIGVLILIVLIFVIAMVKRHRRNVKKGEVLNSAHFGKKKVHRKLMEFEF